MSKARIAGVGIIPFTKPGQSEDWEVMAEKAIRLAIADARVSYDQSQQAYAGYVYGDSTGAISATARTPTAGSMSPTPRAACFPRGIRSARPGWRNATS